MRPNKIRRVLAVFCSVTVLLGCGVGACMNPATAVVSEGGVQ